MLKRKLYKGKREFVEQHGEKIGTRFDGDKTLYLYMVKEFFVEAFTKTMISKVK